MQGRAPPHFLTLRCLFRGYLQERLQHLGSILGSPHFRKLPIIRKHTQLSSVCFGGIPYIEYDTQKEGYGYHSIPK